MNLYKYYNKPEELYKHGAIDTTLMKTILSKEIDSDMAKIENSIFNSSEEFELTDTDQGDLTDYFDEEFITQRFLDIFETIDFAFGSDKEKNEKQLEILKYLTKLDNWVYIVLNFLPANIKVKYKQFFIDGCKPSVYPPITSKYECKLLSKL